MSHSFVYLRPQVLWRDKLIRVPQKRIFTVRPTHAGAQGTQEERIWMLGTFFLFLLPSWLLGPFYFVSVFALLRDAQILGRCLLFFVFFRPCSFLLLVSSATSLNAWKWCSRRFLIGILVRIHTLYVFTELYSLFTWFATGLERECFKLMKL